MFATTLADADRALAASSVDAVLLDLFLPDGDGRSWLTAVAVAPSSAMCMLSSKKPLLVVTML